MRVLEIGAGVMINIVHSITERSLQAIGPWTNEFRGRHGEQSILQQLPKAISRRARRLRKML